MGVEMYVVDDKNKRTFCMGKGPWTRLHPWETLLGFNLEQHRPTREELTAAVRDTWNASDVTEKASPGGYMDRVGELLWRFCEEAAWSVYWGTDCSGDEYLDWPTVGSRYSPFNLDPDPLGGTGWELE